MRIFVLVMLLMCCLGSSYVYGQNPFDIKGRKAPTETTIPVLETKEEAPVIIEAPKETVPEVKIQQEEVQQLSSNPFEVSHVPVRKSEFKSKTMTKEAREVSKSNFFQRNIPLLLLIISLIILAVVNSFRENVINKSFRALFNTNYMKLIKAESLFGFERSYLLLYILFFLNIAVALNHFIYKGQNSFSNLIYLLILSILVYMGRHAFLWILGNVFREIGKKTSDYSFSIHLSNIVFGIIMIPLNFLMVYAFPNAYGFFMVLIIIIGVLIYLNRLARGVLMSSSYLSSNRFHFFLYLCTCEIGPFLIIMKVLKGIIN